MKINKVNIPLCLESLKVQEVHSQSVTATAQRHHVVILLQNDVLLVVKVQEADGLELVGDAARRPHVTGEFECVHDGAHCGVVGGSEVPPQRERTRAGTVVSIVTAGGDDPAGPADLLEVNEERNPLAGLGVAAGQHLWRCASGSAAAVVDLGSGSCSLGWFCPKFKKVFMSVRPEVFTTVTSVIHFLINVVIMV